MQLLKYDILSIISEHSQESSFRPFCMTAGGLQVFISRFNGSIELSSSLAFFYQVVSLSLKTKVIEIRFTDIQDCTIVKTKSRIKKFATIHLLWYRQVSHCSYSNKTKSVRDERAEREDCKPYTLTSHTITHPNQESQRKAGGLRGLRNGLGGLDTRRNRDCRFQLSDKVATKGQGQAKSSVSMTWGAERMWARTRNKRTQDQTDEENTMK